nr:phosphotransferase family protein [Amphibacillus sp. MSJ-3]
MAVLSAQGIVPKLVWTKRLENGDVITAQEWLDGKEMIPEVIQHPKVAELLGRIHHSTELLDMLTRMGKKPLYPITLYRELEQLVQENNNAFCSMTVNRALNWMKKQLGSVINIKPVVCHCDLNHNNWLVTNKGQLYLIDWDNAEIADPALDLAMLFNRYIQEHEWEKWLENYGEKGSRSLYIRVHWYMIYKLIMELDCEIDLNNFNCKVQQLEFVLRRADTYLNSK